MAIDYQGLTKLFKPAAQYADPREQLAREWGIWGDTGTREDEGHGAAIFGPNFTSALQREQFMEEVNRRMNPDWQAEYNQYVPQDLRDALAANSTLSGYGVGDRAVDQYGNPLSYFEYGDLTAPIGDPSRQMAYLPTSVADKYSQLGAQWAQKPTYKETFLDKVMPLAAITMATMGAGSGLAAGAGGSALNAGAGAFDAAGMAGLESGFGIGGAGMGGSVGAAAANASGGATGGEMFVDPWDMLVDEYITYQTPSVINYAGSTGVLDNIINTIKNGGSSLINGLTQPTGTPTGGGSSSMFDMLLKLAPSLVGAYASGQQADSIRELAEQSRADRAPFLSKSLQYLNDPNSYITGPGSTALDGVLRKLSVGGGITDPTKLGIATGAAMNDWRNAVTGFGNLGLAGEDTRANLGMSAINADANVWNALGSGADKVLNPQTSMYDQFKRLRQEGII
jgi:hypothetical protein